MEEALFRTMLFDSYGELLTEKQREYYDLHYNQDLSLGGDRRRASGISRQGVWDIIRRADADAARMQSPGSGWSQRFAAQRDGRGRGWRIRSRSCATVPAATPRAVAREQAPRQLTGSERIDTMAFESLSDKLTEAFKQPARQGPAHGGGRQGGHARGASLALLEADVSYKVVKDFVRKP